MIDHAIQHEPNTWYRFAYRIHIANGTHAMRGAIYALPKFPIISSAPPTY